MIEDGKSCGQSVGAVKLFGWVEVLGCRTGSVLRQSRTTAPVCEASALFPQADSVPDSQKYAGEVSFDAAHCHMPTGSSRFFSLHFFSAAYLGSLFIPTAKSSD
jgi:hypothetical protein